MSDALATEPHRQFLYIYKYINTHTHTHTLTHIYTHIHTLIVWRINNANIDNKIFIVVEATFYGELTIQQRPLLVNLTPDPRISAR